MQFVHYDLGQLSQGQIVEVTLSIAANVRLVDPTNFNLYRSGSSSKYHGGYTDRTPYRVQVPAAGHWHLVIDLGGRSGTLRSSVQILSS